MSAPYPYVKSPISGEDLAASEVREWWRWHFAGQIAAAVLSNDSLLQRVIDGDGVVGFAAIKADALIAALEQERK